jgi:hypothetical protein
LLTKNWLFHHDNAPSHSSFFTRDFFHQKTIWLSSPPTLLFFVSQIEDKTKRLPFWHSWGGGGRSAGNYFKGDGGQ